MRPVVDIMTMDTQDMACMCAMCLFASYVPHGTQGALDSAHNRLRFISIKSIMPLVLAHCTPYSACYSSSYCVTKSKCDE